MGECLSALDGGRGETRSLSEPRLDLSDGLGVALVRSSVLVRGGLGDAERSLSEPRLERSVGLGVFLPKLSALERRRADSCLGEDLSASESLRDLSLSELRLERSESDLGRAESALVRQMSGRGGRGGRVGRGTLPAG